MNGSRSRSIHQQVTRNLLGHFRALSQWILQYGSHGSTRVEFLRQVLQTLSEFAGCEAAELRLRERGQYYRYTLDRRAQPSFRVDTQPLVEGREIQIFCHSDAPPLEALLKSVVTSSYDTSSPHFTAHGTFWTGDLESVIREMGGEDGRRGIESIRPAGLPVKTLALIPLGVKGENPGLLQLMSEHPDYFAQEDVEFYEGLVQILGVALAYGLTQVALRERVKELTCLYGISRLAERPNPSLAAFLQGVADLLPPAWLYPEVASGRVRLDGQTYTTPGFREDTQRLAAEIVVAGRERGVVEVTYTEEKPEIDEGPFLKEERHLIDTIAREIALIIKRREAEEARARLEEQLRHADRLATIGQLAAGVAHELNEPLGSVLGFAQLAQKCPDLPKAAARDIERIVSAALHAREIIRKLRLFAREAPPETTRVNLNRIVDEGLFFFERRCANSGIELVRSLEPDLPEVVADASQLNQVLINLVVNAIQAIPRAGRITVKTLTDADQALLVVEDTGIGMSEEVQKQIFIPFFTTKDIDEGTGLGLPVVHGIVTSHGGSIRVHSEEGRGTRFEVRLPIAPERSRTEEDPNGDRD